MKRFCLVTLLVALVMLSPTFVFSADYYFSKETIKVTQEKDYLVVTVVNKQIKEPIVYRIYPCGKVDKSEWKEIAPNKEPVATVWYSNPTDIITMTDSTDIEIRR